MANSTSPKKGRLGINTFISWGASVVIIGLMIKLLHLPGGEYAIAIGLGTEAFLFFILGIQAMNTPEDEKPEIVKDLKKSSPLDDMLNTTVTQQTIERLQKGFENFTKTVESVNQITGYAGVTQKMIQEMEQATIQIQQLNKNVAAVNRVYQAQLEAFKK